MDKFIAFVIVVFILALALFALASPDAGAQIGAFVAALVRGYQEARQ